MLGTCPMRTTTFQLAYIVRRIHFTVDEKGREKVAVVAGCDEGQSGVGVLVPESAQCRCHNKIRRTQQHSGIDDEVNAWILMSLVGVATIFLLTKGTATGQGSAWCVPKSRGGPMSYRLVLAHPPKSFCSPPSSYFFSDYRIPSLSLQLHPPPPIPPTPSAVLLKSSTGSHQQHYPPTSHPLIDDTDTGDQKSICTNIPLSSSHLPSPHLFSISSFPLPCPHPQTQAPQRHLLHPTKTFNSPISAQSPIHDLRMTSSSMRISPPSKNISFCSIRPTTTMPSSNWNTTGGYWSLALFLLTNKGSSETKPKSSSSMS